MLKVPEIQKEERKHEFSLQFLGVSVYIQPLPRHGGVAERPQTTGAKRTHGNVCLCPSFALFAAPARCSTHTSSSITGQEANHKCKAPSTPGLREAFGRHPDTNHNEGFHWKERNRTRNIVGIEWTEEIIHEKTILRNAQFTLFSLTPKLKPTAKQPVPTPVGARFSLITQVQGKCG